MSAVSTDTRTLEDGAVYLALKGPNFNGHDFISTAEKAGASAVIASEDVATSLPVIMVEDTKEALGLLGAAVKACGAQNDCDYRKQWQNHRKGNVCRYFGAKRQCISHKR